MLETQLFVLTKGVINIMNKGKTLVVTSLVLMVMFIDMGRSENKWDQPFDEVYEPNIVHPRIDLEVVIVDDANKECKKYTNDINYQVEHCALQYKPRNGVRKCVLVMQRDELTMGDLGHELRHCLEGDWHKARPTRGVKR